MSLLTRDALGGNFVPTRDLTRYYKATRDCLWNKTTVCQRPRLPISHHLVERGAASRPRLRAKGGLAHDTQPQRTCPSCGNEFSVAMEFCPVCVLRKALADGVESGESSASEGTAKPTLERAVQRFEHYELVTGEDGKPVELGCGAMGVTYKAFDVDLRCPVTLKVISERYLGDEFGGFVFFSRPVRRRLRHSNVASVLHLGRTGQNYFYAMEFVEGETLENLIRRSGKLEIKLALKIVAQVAAGLAAVHEQNLVHRDIKPTNIMVRLKEEVGVTAKVIDLGLAKTLDESASEAGFHRPGHLSGHPSLRVRSNLRALVWTSVRICTRLA
jgi:Protein kinase domain